MFTCWYLFEFWKPWAANLFHALSRRDSEIEEELRSSETNGPFEASSSKHWHKEWEFFEGVATFRLKFNRNRNQGENFLLDQGQNSVVFCILRPWCWFRFLSGGVKNGNSLPERRAQRCFMGPRFKIYEEIRRRKKEANKSERKLRKVAIWFHIFWGGGGYSARIEPIAMDHTVQLIRIRWSPFRSVRNRSRESCVFSPKGLLWGSTLVENQSCAMSSYVDARNFRLLWKQFNLHGEKMENTGARHDRTFSTLLTLQIPRDRAKFKLGIRCVYTFFHFPRGIFSLQG